MWSWPTFGRAEACAHQDGTLRSTSACSADAATTNAIQDDDGATVAHHRSTWQDSSRKCGMQRTCGQLRVQCAGRRRAARSGDGRWGRGAVAAGAAAVAVGTFKGMHMSAVGPAPQFFGTKFFKSPNSPWKRTCKSCLRDDESTKEGDKS